MSHSFSSSALWAFVLMLPLCSCSGGKDVTVQDADSGTVCEIMSVFGDEEIGSPCSLAVIDSAHFAISTDYQVYLYDMSGHCISKIGRSGNAGFEYNMPLYVRCDGDLIYVWSAMTMKFVAYTLDGTPVGEYGYDSALRDFCPSGDYIVIYTAGNRGDHIIDIYDKTCCQVVKSLGNSSDAHKVLCGWMSAAPFFCSDGGVHYLPLDRLDVMKYDMGTDLLLPVAGIESETFKPVQVKGDMDYPAAREYRNTNPCTMLAVNRGGNLYVLTSEGRYNDSPDRILNNENRYCSLYRVEGRGGRKIACFTVSSLGYGNLMSVYDGEIYFIRHSIEDDRDVYTLSRLNLPE